MSMKENAAAAEDPLIVACQTLHASDGPVSLEHLAGEAGLSPATFQRRFRAALGVTPRQYASALQRERAQVALGQAPRITDAVFEAGFATPSRFYARAHAMLGMSPSAWRAGGQDVAIAHAVVDTTLGPLLVAASDIGVCRVAFGEVPDATDEQGDGNDADALIDALERHFPRATLGPGDARFERTVGAVAALVSEASESRRQRHEIPLDIEGTLFQSQVWRVLQGIPRGSTMSYAEVAAAIGRPSAHRAVANACGANPVALLIPCHRVTRRGGGLGGYRWGVARKRSLLAMESSEVPPPARQDTAGSSVRVSSTQTAGAGNGEPGLHGRRSPAS